ncbi:MAG: cupin-like domain-containing protein [Sphingomonadales bacterium]|nr:cupin-like domain-containing protein [Sphingomonadales bacterium]MDE2570567.1 cupin-like domain-containing protein [Sphingomonadales bacterium]
MTFAMSVHQPPKSGARLGAFGERALAQFARAYPSASAGFAHELAGHPLLGLEALADAAARMDPRHVEVRAADNRNGEEFAFAAPEGAGAPDTIRAIGKAGRWVMLRFVEQLPEFEALLSDTLGEITPVIRAITGKPERLQGFIFISSPGTLTPFHFDPEFNILMQVSGRKYFTVYPPEAPWLTDEKQERFHRDGDNLLPWRTGDELAGWDNVLDPGDALYVPFKCPHWVRVGDQPSISLSLTWCSPASQAQNDAWRFNGWLRTRGIGAAPPAMGAPLTRAKALGWRALRRAGLAGTDI